MRTKLIDRKLPSYSIAEERFNYSILYTLIIVRFLTL